MLFARVRKPVRVVAASVLVLAAVPLAIDGGRSGNEARAELIAAFLPPAYTTNAAGAIDIVGNALLTCGTTATCLTTLAGTNNSGNGSFSMVDLDADNGILPAAASSQTTNSSAATFAPPAGSTVLYASLHWSSESSAATRNQLSFLPPGAAAYQTVTGAVNAAGSLYQSTADVTALVRAAGPGEYWAGNIQRFTGTNTFAAWSMVVVYANPGLPVRNLSVFDGFGRVNSGFTQLDVPITGFLTPPFGSVRAEIGVVAYEGDRNITGDQVLIDTNPGAGTTFTNLSDASNPTLNFGNGSITNAGVADASGRPSTVNNLSLDADEFATVNVLANAQTDTTVRFQTTGDAWYPGVLTTAIDLFVPEFPSITKTVTDLNGGDAVPGDQLEYSLTFSNTGNDGALASTVRDTIPANTTFVPGSLRIGGVAQSDGANDDRGEFTGTEIVARVGSGATATTGGSILPGESASVTFRVTVVASARGTTIQNTGRLDYTAQTIGTPFTFNTNTVVTPVPPLVDLRVTKTGSPNPVAPGEPVTWTIDVFNDGPNTATGVTLSDSLTNATFASVSGATCPGASIGATTISCVLADIAAGSSRTVTIVSNTSPSLLDGTTVGNTATVDSNEDDGDPTNNSGSGAVIARPRADLEITKTDSADPVRPGDSVTYTITVTNNGPSDAHQVQISDQLPVSVTPTSVSLVAPAVGSCVLATRTCTVPVVANGTSVQMSVIGTVQGSASGAIANAATVVSADTDPDTTDNSTSETTTVTPVADLSVAKTTLDAPVVAGEQVTYRVRVTNAGPSPAIDTAVTDSLDPSLTLVSAAPSQGSCTGTSVIACQLGTLGAGAVVDVIITADVAATASGQSLQNTATASSPTDFTPGNNSGSTSGTVQNSSDLRIRKEVDQNPIVAGGRFEYTITVTNDGPSASSGIITVVDDVPAPLVVGSVSAPCVATGNSVSCASSAPLAVGASLVYTISGTVPSAASTPDVDNEATVSYTGTDPNSTNNSAVAATDLIAEADVTIDKEWAASSFTAGGNAQFTLAVTNGGPSVASNVVASDALPAGMTFVSATGASCVGTTTIDCAVGTMASGQVTTITVTVAVAPETPAGPTSNSASANSVAAGPIPATLDRNPSNNSDTDATQIVRTADLAITKVASVGSPVAGEVVEYTVVVTNNGPSTARATFVGDALPAGMTLVAPVPAPSQGSCSNNAGALSCDLGIVGVGAANAVTVTYAAVIGADVAPGTVLTNTATATSTEPDPTPATVNESVTVATEADLVVSKTASADPATPGGPLTYTVTIVNDGPSDARDVSITDPVPAGFTATSATSTLGTCDLTVDCTIGTIAAGAQVDITITGTVTSSFTGTLTNTTDPVQSSTTLLDTADDVGAVSVATAAAADLTVTKSASPTTIDAGGGLVTYVVNVSNSGPSDALSVDVTDTLPAGFVVDSVTPSQGTCSSNAVCALGTVGAGDPPATITYVGYFPSTQPAGPVTNEATASSPTDPNGPSTATVDVEITATADVSVAKSGPLVATAGEDVQYIIAVQNSGPSAATNVAVSDVLDASILDAIGATGSLIPASAGTCANNAGTIECNFASVAVGALISVVVDVDVLPSAATGTANLSNTATITSDTADPAPGDNSSTVTSDVNAVSDLRVVKTKPGSTQFTAGRAAPYEIVVTNLGPSVAGGVVVSDVAPSGMTFGAVTSSPAGCTALPCAIGGLAVGDSVTVTVQATVAASSNSTSVANTATVSSTTLDGNGSNNSSTLTNGVIRRADMVLASKTDAPDPVSAGGTLTYTIVARNDGPSVAQDAAITDVVPVGTTLVAASLPTNCATTGISTGSTITCDLGDLGVAATSTVTFRFIVGPDLEPPATVSNTATVSSATIDPDTSTASNSKTAQTTIGTLADVGITKSADPATAVPGDPLTYTLTVTNVGPSTARAVTVDDDVSAIFTAGTVAVNVVGGPATVSCDTTVACGPFDMPVGSFVIEITGTVDPSLTAGLTNVASLATSTPQPALGLPDSATLATPVAPAADLVITKSANPATITPSGTVTYTIEVTNSGASDAQNVVITDTLPPDLTIVSIDSTSFGAVCDDGTVDGTVSCDIATLPAGGTAIVTIVAAVGPRAVGTVANVARVTSSTPDPTPANTITTLTTPVAPRADVQVTKSTLTSPIVAGQPARYRVVVFNNGPAVATSVVVTDVLPTNASFVNASTPIGTCTHDGSAAGGVLTCALGGLNDQSRVQIDIDMLVAPDATGTMSNTASATSATIDPTPGNNDATNPGGSTSDPVVTAPDLRLQKSLVDPNLTAGDSFEYVIEIFNDGPSDALGDIVLSDVLPAQIVSAAAAVTLSNTTNCTYTQSTREVSCTFTDDLAVGDSISITITGTIDAAASTVDDNTAIVTTADADPDLTNNTSTASASLATNADLVTAKAFDAGSVVAGQTTQFAISVTNNGPSVAVDAELADVLPAGWTVVSLASPTNGFCTNTLNSVSCINGSLAVGASISVEVTARVPATAAAGPITNTATADSATPDRNPSNNTAVDGISVTRLANLTLTKEASSPTVVAGGRLTYTLTITSTGPSSAEATVVGDQLPAGVLIDPASLDPRCTAPGNVLDCSLGELVPGGVPVELTYEVIFDPALVDGSSITNAARADSVTPLGTPATDSVTVDIVTEADLELLDKTVTPNPGIAGEAVTYTIRATNNGPSVARNAEIVDDLPVGLTPVTPLPFGCRVEAGDLVCDLGDVAVLQSVEITFDALIDAAVADGATLTNSAAISSPDTADPDTTNDTASVDLDVEAVADVTIAKSANPSAAVPGNRLTYTLTVTNLGPSNAQGVSVEDLTLGFFVPGSITATSDQGSCDATVSCLIGELAPGSTTIRISGIVAPGITTAIENTASVTTATTQPPGGQPNEVTISTPVAPTADLAITKTLDTSPPVPGEPVRYTITVTNPGPSSAQNVTITDSLDPAVTNLAADQAVCSFTGQDLGCAVGTLAPGTLEVVVTGDLDASFTGDLANSAAVATTTDQGLNASPDTSSVTSAATPRADLRLTKTATPDPVIAGESVTYEITVTNDGPSTAIGVRVDDELPAGLTVLSIDSSQGGCAALPCVLGDLADTASATVTIEAVVDSDLVVLAPNDATVTSATSDPNTANNEATAEPAVATLARVTTTKTLLTPTAVPGTRITWLITLANAGPSTARDVTVADAIPAFLTGVTVESSQGGCVSFDCVLGSIADEGSATITVSGDLPASVPPGTLGNTATTTSSTVDDDPSDNEAEASNPIVPAADVRVTKTGPMTNVVAGSDVSWTVTVVNDGPSDAQDIVVRDDLPTALDASTIEIDEGGASCTLTAFALRCDIATLAARGSVTITIDGTLRSDFDDPELENVATVSASTPDLDPTNNEATATSTNAPLADLVVTGSATPSSVDAGDSTTFAFTVVNEGPSDAASTVITIPIPAGVALSGTPTVIGAPGAIVTVVDGVITVDLGNLPPDTPVTISFEGTISPDQPIGDVSLTATGTTTTAQSDTDDDAATVVVDVGSDIDLSIVKTASVPSVDVGDSITFTIVVTNEGSSTAAPVTVVDELPAGLDPTAATGPDGPCDIDGSEVRCEGLAVAGSGGTAKVSIVATATGNGEVRNTATAECVCIVSPVSSDEAPVDIVRTSDLSASKAVSVTQVNAGGSVTFTVTVRNDGPDAAVGVVVTDRMPDGLSVVISNPSVGAYDPTTGRWVIGDLGVGQVATLTVGARADRIGSYTNVATLDSEVTDPDAADNRATASVAVLAVDLPRTGGDVWRTVGWAAALVTIGFALLTLRSRRHDVRVHPGD